MLEALTNFSYIKLFKGNYAQFIPKYKTDVWNAATRVTVTYCNFSKDNNTGV